jgi:peptidoglycan/LPS O-acetylase OafA/YrhL
LAADRPPAGATGRDRALDIFRGIAITEVLLHHVAAFAMRNTAAGTLSHDLLILANRTLHFAVPAFLFIMGLLLTRTMLSGQRSWREFYERRARQTLVPYLIWTLFYVLFRVLVVPQDPPSVLLDTDRWRVWLLWGKAWYHLYFLVLALQLYLVFPFILAALRRKRIGLGSLALVGLAAQLAAHWAHARWIRSPFPASMLIWYVMPVLCGVWVGLHLEEWPSIWRRLRFVAIPLLVLGWAIYLPQGYLRVKGLPVNSHLYHFSYWAYTLGVAFCGLTFCRWLQRRGGRTARTFQSLGGYTMAIYLVHPMLLHLWSMVPQSGSTLRFHLMTLLAAVTVFGASLLIARLAARTASAAILFGRGDARVSA